MDEVSDVAGYTPLGFLGGVANKEGKAAKNSFDQFLASLDPGEKPTDPGYTGITDAQGNLLDRFKLSDGSGYSKIAGEKLQQDLADARNIAALSGAGANANARASLASRGGLTPAMAAMLASEGEKAQMGAQQDVTLQGVRGNQDIAGKQFDIGREAEKANVGSLITNQGNLNQYNLNKYAQDMQGYAAGKTAQAQYAATRGKGQRGGIMGGVGSVLGK